MCTDNAIARENISAIQFNLILKIDSNWLPIALYDSAFVIFKTHINHYLTFCLNRTYDFETKNSLNTKMVNKISFSSLSDR